MTIAKLLQQATPGESLTVLAWEYITKEKSTMKMTKKQVLEQFKELWTEAVKNDPTLKGDSIAKREAFNNYVDALNKDGLVTDSQAFNWSNPF